jgi:hypothetical protein
VQLREIGAEFRGQDFATSLYFSLLAGNLGRKVSARLLPLPFSLHCREISPNRPRNRRNCPYFAIVSMKPRAEKTLLSNDNAFYRPFSPGAQERCDFCKPRWRIIGDHKPKTLRTRLDFPVFSLVRSDEQASCCCSFNGNAIVVTVKDWASRQEQESREIRESLETLELVDSICRARDRDPCTCRPVSLIAA